MTRRRPSILSTALLAALALAAAAASAQQAVSVAQKRRTFSPAAVAVEAGGSVAFVNDDGELLHHVYAQDPRFSFDIGEEAPGTQVLVRFPVRGTFQVRCEIHPRMLLQVTVR